MWAKLLSACTLLSLRNVQAQLNLPLKYNHELWWAQDKTLSMKINFPSPTAEAAVEPGKKNGTSLSLRKSQ